MEHSYLNTFAFLAISWWKRATEAMIGGAITTEENGIGAVDKEERRKQVKVDYMLRGMRGSSGTLWRSTLFCHMSSAKPLSPPGETPH
jgi:hypothetical protein